MHFILCSAVFFVTLSFLSNALVYESSDDGDHVFIKLLALCDMTSLQYFTAGVENLAIRFDDGACKDLIIRTGIYHQGDCSPLLGRETFRYISEDAT